MESEGRENEEGGRGAPELREVERQKGRGREGDFKRGGEQEGESK